MRTLEELRAGLTQLGAKPLHQRRLLRHWLGALPLDSPPKRPGDFLPTALKQALPTLESQWSALAQVSTAHPGMDGSERLVVSLADGQAVETVLLPRDGVCVSTQVGCAVGCVFCMTGRDGLARHLGSAEIVAQVALARARARARGHAVKKVVFMGMGEPAHNMDAVMEAIEVLGNEGQFAHKNLVFSTVGDRRVFERLPLGPVKPALALSLHTTKPELRARLLPRAPRIDPEELVEQAEVYARSTGYPIQFQWTLLDGVNDGDDEIEGVVRLLSGKYAVLNVIPFNRVEGSGYSRPPAERVTHMARTLCSRGVLTKIRQSAGQDVDAGCGQLRARVMTRVVLEKGKVPAIES